MLANDLAMYCAFFQYDIDHVLTSTFQRFLNSNRHFARFTTTHANTTITIANDHNRCETKNSTTFDYFSIT